RKRRERDVTTGMRIYSSLFRVARAVSPGIDAIARDALISKKWTAASVAELAPADGDSPRVDPERPAALTWASSRSRGCDARLCASWIPPRSMNQMSNLT